MKPVKDNFSTQAEHYQRYRPDYPEALFKEVMDHCPGFDLAWDCATGNGQVAKVLAKDFKKVVATDISAQQLQHAPQVDNIHYKQGRAENSMLSDHSVDLITIGQAIHWFDFDKFYAEVQRVLKPQGIIAAWTYGVFRVNPEIDKLIEEFYTNVVGPYWDVERKLIDQEYKTIPFPFHELKVSKDMNIHKNWNLEDLEGYLNTWSSVGHFKKRHKRNPVGEITEQIRPYWSKTLSVRFPIFIRVGKLA